MFSVFIIDDDKYAVESVYNAFPWKELLVNNIKKIYIPNDLTKLILEEKPDIVFIDIEIYDVSGLDIIKECRENGSDCIFIVISGHDDFSYARTAVNSGVLYYILKPIQPNDVSEITQKLKKALSIITENDDTSQALSWNKIDKYIKSNYHLNLRVQDICNKFFIERRTFFRIMNENSNVSFVEYLTNIRIEAAMNLLLTTTDTLSSISTSVGISDHRYFLKIFKKRTGTTPSEFRKQNGGIK